MMPRLTPHLQPTVDFGGLVEALGMRVLQNVEANSGLAGLADYCKPTVQRLVNQHINQGPIDLGALGFLFSAIQNGLRK